MNDPEMVPCDHVIAQLWEYIDGELTAENATRVRAHLDICSRCFPQYDFQRAFKEFLQQSAQQPMPPGVRRRVFEAILAEENGSVRPGGGRGLTDRVRAFLDRVLRRSG